ncbi:prepilin-type N-terminal cleavage/methylation domain-containing protein [Verminephrobacter eiseniae]|nr:prepilin-type N-terminal cleavage/methylation domain-containing protein [Verminephrobacter eiseniae]
MTAPTTPTTPAMPGIRRRGFTLVEVLVVMALLSLVMLALGASLRTVAQTQERVDARLAQTDQWRVAVAFIRSSLGRISGRKIEAAATAAPGSGKYLFAGAPDAVAWVGVMPARFGAGGRNFFRLAAEPVDGAGLGLVLRFKPWEEASAFPDWSTADSRVLLADVASLSIRYQGQAGSPADGWLPRWSDPDRLPHRAWLTLRSAASEWPPLIIALHQLPLSDARSIVFTVGGSSP